MNLVDLEKYKTFNNGYRWILTTVEISSRFAFTVTAKKKDTKNMAEAVEKILKKFTNILTNIRKLHSSMMENNFTTLV